MGGGRLPGALSSWRAWWLLFWYRGRIPEASAKWFAVAMCALAGVYLLALGDIRAVAAAIPVLATAAFLAYPFFRLFSGSPVTADSQPELRRLVERVAAHLEAPMPDRVILIHWAYVSSVAAGRRRELRIGLGALSFLTSSQLEALVAHELAPLRYRDSWLVLRLREIYQEEWGGPATRRHRRERILARLADFWSAVEDESDAAAIRFGSAGNAADAVVAVALGAGENVEYSLDQRLPTGYAGIQDLDDGWRHYLAHGGGSTVDGDYEDVANKHTILAEPIRRVGEVRLRMADGRVEVAPLSEPEQRRLAQRSLLMFAPAIQFRLRRIRWYTFATVPRQWWVARAQRQVELMRSYWGIAAEADVLDALDDSDDATAGLRLYVECQLLQGGWRLEHPAVRTVLISPAGERVDLSTMDRRAAAALLP